MSPQIPTSRIILILGPASSGKSEWAEKLARESGKAVIYIATARENPKDPEWQDKIARHASRRPRDWQLRLVPVELAVTVGDRLPENCLLVDSLGTWLANLLDLDEESWEKIVTDLLNQLQRTTGDIILVAEETGWGIVPSYPLGRIFRDRLGNLTRRIGAIASEVYLITGGYALNLTQLGVPLGDPQSF